LYGRYDDVWTRIDSTWQTAHRRLSCVGGDPVFSASLRTHERRPAPPDWSWP
jgi:hypothetical protein